MKTIRARGDFFSVGQAVGEATRDDLLSAREQSDVYLAKYTTLGEEDSIRRALEPLTAEIEAYFPPAVEYLRGLARGAGVAAEEVLRVMLYEDLYESYHKEKCSTLVVRAGGGWLLGHIEDFDPYYLGRLSFLDLSFDGWPRLIGCTYAGNPPGLAGSLNDRGLAISNNALTAGYGRGVSKQIRHFRACLASGVDEAAGFLRERPVLADHFTLISAAEGRAISVEVAPSGAAETGSVTEPLGDAPFFHTNTVRSLKLRVADGSSRSSRLRQAKLEKYCAGPLPDTADGLLELLSEPDGVLRRAPGDDPVSIALATLVIAPSSGEFIVREYGVGDETVRRFMI